MKKVHSIHRQGEGHWVGDGFRVPSTTYHSMLLSPKKVSNSLGLADEVFVSG